jgi:hypothetical protein
MEDALERGNRLSLPRPAPREKALSPQAFSAVLSCLTRGQRWEVGGQENSTLARSAHSILNAAADAFQIVIGRRVN